MNNILYYSTLKKERKMPNTYTQIYIHYVFATEIRMPLIKGDKQQELYAYSAGIVRDLNCFMQCIGGMEDHVHLLVGLHPTLSVSEFAQKFKANTSRFINEKGWVLGKFNWQGGFGAFSVSQSGLMQVRDYIRIRRNTIEIIPSPVSMNRFCQDTRSIMTKSMFFTIRNHRSIRNQPYQVPSGRYFR